MFGYMQTPVCCRNSGVAVASITTSFVENVCALSIMLDDMQPDA